MNLTIVAAVVALLAFQPSYPEAAPGRSGQEGRSPFPLIEPAPSRSAEYRLIARIDDDQPAPAAIFLHDIVELGSNRLAELLIVPLRKTHRYSRGQPSHGRLWYEISCEHRALRVVRSRLYDPDDTRLPEHDQSFARPMMRALPSETRYPDLIVPHVCGGAAAEGPRFTDPLAAVAYARTGR